MVKGANFDCDFVVAHMPCRDIYYGILSCRQSDNGTISPSSHDLTAAQTADSAPQFNTHWERNVFVLLLVV